MCNLYMNRNTAADPSGEPTASAARLAPALLAAVERALPENGAAVAFSGGVDSALVAWLAARSSHPVSLYTVGLPEARDIAAARQASAVLGLAGRQIVIETGPDEVLEAAGRIHRALPEATLLEVSFLAPAFIVFERASEGTVLTGDGADELFGGYNRYLRMDERELAESLERDIGALLAGGIQRNRSLAEAAGKRLGTPYLDPEVVSVARSIPPSLRVFRGERKAVLRRTAALLGLPPGICSAPKRAAQYGSGIHALLLKKRFMQ